MTGKNTLAYHAGPLMKEKKKFCNILTRSGGRGRERQKEKEKWKLCHLVKKSQHQQF